MRRILPLALAFALASLGALAQPSGGNPAQAPTPAATSGNCAKWNGQNKLADAGAPCGTGGSVSITAGAGIVVSPSPITGTGTVSANISGTPTAGNCVTWATSTQFGDAGAACGGGGSSPIVNLTFSGTTLSTFGYGNCFRSNETLPAITTGKRISFAVTIRRPSATTVGIGLINSSGNGFVWMWQGDNNMGLSRLNAGSSNALQFSGGTVPTFTPSWLNMRMFATGDTTNGLNLWAATDDYYNTAWKRDATYDLSSGTWYACIYAAGITSADLGAAAYSIGPLPQ